MKKILIKAELNIVKKPKYSLSDYIDRRIDASNKPSKHIGEKKCKNCKNLQANPLYIDCRFPYFKTEDCLTDNYKHFESKL